MKTKLPQIAFMSLICFSFLLTDSAHAISAAPEPEVIYGEDGRLDLYQIENPRLMQLADSTVALFEAANVEPDPSGQKALLKTSHYGQSMNLCPKEPFYDQPMGAFCSGSLVGPDLVMTAGHCVRSQEACAGAKFVFGFGVGKAGIYPAAVPAEEVYGCAQLVARQEEYSGADWALVRLERKVPNHAPLKLNRTGKLEKETKIFVIGHPAGLPTKVAGGATVRDPSPKGYFVANLDTYGGNSGSAVFNAANGRVEGILVRGETDYEQEGDCRVSKVCPDAGCRGEDVTKISALASQIPALESPAKPRTPKPATLPNPGRLAETVDSIQLQW
ncbi:MAG: trypsin-like peptidase domain-containing protein [Elusimicrobia bacterium]|nr:trypsin-like peptidase domain-containing protein [Elusimicrobiota bacterium]